MPNESCSAIEAALSTLGRAWAGAVLDAILTGAERFSEIRRAVPGVTDAVLSARLRDLCDRGFVTREVEPGPPVAVRYRPTAVGADARAVLDALREFGERHHAALIRHPQPKASA